MCSPAPCPSGIASWIRHSSVRVATLSDELGIEGQPAGLAGARGELDQVL